MKVKGLMIVAALMINSSAHAEAFNMMYKIKGLSGALAKAPSLGLSSISCGLAHCYALRALGKKLNLHLNELGRIYEN